MFLNIANLYVAFKSNGQVYICMTDLNNNNAQLTVASTINTNVQVLPN